MKPRNDLRILRSANVCSCPETLLKERCLEVPHPAWNSLLPKLVSASALLLLPFGAMRLSAQQYWPPDDSTTGQYGAAPQPQQYAPAQQYSYSQPQYSQPQSYPQQPYQAPPQPYAQQGYGQQLSQTQALSPDQLTQLVAPIALYPDGLVAQILAASTYPAQVSAADQWLRSMGNVSPEQIAAGADAQSSWDPSVKALTAFPQVLALLDGNLQWTTSLGNAYYNQPQDVLQTIQVMRQRAEQAGNLESTPQEEVSENQGNIDIAPANPQVVYVPTYNPWEVYGQQVSPYPGFSLIGALGSFFGSSPVQFGLSFAMDAFMHTPWGFLGWGLDWLAHSVLFNHGSYYTHSTSVADWGFPRGGPRAYPGVPQWNRGGGYGNGWSHDGYYRSNNHSVEGPNRGFGQPVGRPVERFGDARSREGFNRGFPSRSEAYARPALPPQEAYNRYPQAVGRPQQFENRSQAYAGRQEQFGRPGYGSAYSNPSRNSYSNREGMAFANPSQSYRAPENGYRGESGVRGYSGYPGDFGKSAHSGGFHLFGNHNSDGYSGRAPKAYSFNSGGGHSSWGGSGGWKAPKAGRESHFGGGGGHWGGGGHSSGGHSSHHH
jgi:hypothetical protein